MASSGTRDPVAAHSATIAVACGSFQPITYSKTDTEETRRQVRAHNAVGMKICGWKP